MFALQFAVGSNSNSFMSFNDDVLEMESDVSLNITDSLKQCRWFGHSVVHVPNCAS